MSPDLWVVCLSAFGAVFVLLSSLAAVMRVLILVFPEKAAPGADVRGTDAAVVAAVTSAVGAAYPGTRVTKIEESR